jgi:hypothetical protein
VSFQCATTQRRVDKSDAFTLRSTLTHESSIDHSAQVRD